MDSHLPQLLDIKGMKEATFPISLFLSVLQVVAATSPAQDGAGDQQRITARPVSV